MTIYLYKKNVSIGGSEYNKSLSQEEKIIKYGKANNGKTCKIINGKRGWMDKGDSKLQRN